VLQPRDAGGRCSKGHVDIRGLRIGAAYAVRVGKATRFVAAQARGLENRSTCCLIETPRLL